jgi:hypothetical protein
LLDRQAGILVVMRRATRLPPVAVLMGRTIERFQAAYHGTDTHAGFPPRFGSNGETIR